ncbi:MAG: hypothetical protein U0573_02755 [Phycisphaerales bacterium]|nr:hypothetical protein [Planctomycetota bacterium]
MNHDNRSADEVAKERAAAAVEAARQLGDAELDYSLESVRYVEQTLAEFHKEGLRSNTHPNTVWAIACYLGEVIVRQAGGEWIWGRDFPDKFPGPPELPYVRLPGDVTISTFGKVAGRLDGDDGDNVEFFCKMIMKTFGPGAANPKAQDPTPSPPPGPSKPSFWKRLFGKG